jgi:predicted nuclease of restriction endonuclease-like (RecB) superfamily
MTPNTQLPTILVTDIRSLILEVRQRVAISVNIELTALHWQIGNRLQQEILGNERADYGKMIVKGVAKQLTEEFGSGFSDKTLRHCIRLAEVLPDFPIVSTLSRQLSWSHFLEIMYLPDDLKRQFYFKMCQLERWSVRRLRERIDSQLFERTAISRKPEELIRQELDKLPTEAYPINPDLVFRDTYVLDFLGLKDTYSEHDLEDAILQHLQQFLIELGTDFAFMGRQRRITIDGQDYKIDLLFYHRRMKRLVVFDLKLRKFQAGDKGQMELYLRWLQKHEQLPDELPPIGLILCSDASGEHVELMLLDEDNIRVAQYLTILPSREVLQAQLHRAIEVARSRFET